MFTLNNYTEDDIDRLCDMDPDKALVVIGLEVAPTTGTPHLQATSSLETIVLFPLSVVSYLVLISRSQSSLLWLVACIAQRTDSG